ncbi:hypothetical protein FSARC_8800 [Fusarium sarcochroum]|uniref:DUF7707 domain-containing protein n=1 Tax=Fusarium sarcochroum TaxID=1208366 RepID=A0A8H4TSL2_9HYPO|nr:hypothetical protein FSARC_8800 [Fusarium sarcochroum]
MRPSFAVLAMAISAVSAQTVKSYKSSLDMTIDPNSVDIGQRSDWCGAQQNTCDTLCGDDTDKNSCDEDELKWQCTCTSNSSAPGLQYYTQTMPTFICQTLFSQCITQYAGNSDGQKQCTSKIDAKCAKQSPPKNVAKDDDDDEDATSTASDTATASATKSSSSSTGTAEAVSTTASDGFAAPTMAPAGKGAAAAIALGMLAYMI